MSEPLDRDEVIRLLDQLGDDQDADVLQAARELHRQITAAGMDWDDLLVADTAAESANGDDSPVEDSPVEEVEAAEAPPVAKQGKNADSLALIEKLLAMPNRSEALREELEEYKADIANGEFEARDHEYVRALYKRLTK